MPPAWCTGCGETFAEAAFDAPCPHCGRSGTVIPAGAKDAQVAARLAKDSPRPWLHPVDRPWALVALAVAVLGVGGVAVSWLGDSRGPGPSLGIAVVHEGPPRRSEDAPAELQESVREATEASSAGLGPCFHDPGEHRLEFDLRPTAAGAQDVSLRDSPADQGTRDCVRAALSAAPFPRVPPEWRVLVRALLHVQRAADGLHVELEGLATP